MRDYGRELGFGVNVEPSSDSWQQTASVVRAANRAGLDLVGIRTSAASWTRGP